MQLTLTLEGNENRTIWGRVRNGRVVVEDLSIQRTHKEISKVIIININHKSFQLVQCLELSGFLRN